MQGCENNTSSSRQYCGLNSFAENRRYAIHVQVDNIAASTYLMKRGGTQNLKMIALAKEIWEYLLKWEITITAEYLPSELK